MYFPKLDALVKGPKAFFPVIPAKAGIQLFQNVLDPGFCRGDDSEEFLRDHQTSNLGLAACSFFYSIHAPPFT
jgi:hypothetical protein